ncbi:MAG: hypothetical protein QME49_07095 [bacterium]|nr:hypothetical protein [bacterium]
MRDCRTGNGNKDRFIIEKPELAQRYMEDVPGARVLREKDFSKKK